VHYNLVTEEIITGSHAGILVQTLVVQTPFFVSEQLQETRVEEKSTMNFVLMVRKGHKQQYKSLAVPINSELALNLKNREEVRA
jgi:regulator of nonsense transcripts 2